MRFIAKLVVFAIGLTVVLGAYRLVERVKGGDNRARVVEISMPAEAPERPELAERPEAVEAVEPAAAARPVLRDGEVHILTTNRAAFMALRERHIVAGLSDSLRRHVEAEMRRELAKADAPGVGAAIGKAVVQGVSKVLEGEISVPLNEVRDISYDRNRIVIVYRKGEPKGLNLETIKMDGDRTLLEQFSEADARRFVEAVRVRLK